MKSLFYAISILPTILISVPIFAQTDTENTVKCYFFEGDRLELKQNCEHVSTSILDVIHHKLTWEDGVTTKIEILYISGVQYQGYADTGQVDGYDAFTYHRDRSTLERIGRPLKDENSSSMLICWETYKFGNSVCIE
jgi:hypothetical protein